MLTGIEEFFIFGLVPLMIGIFTAPLVADVAERTVSGKVIIPPSPALSSDAVAIVELVEQRRGETIVPALARETISWHGGRAQRFAIRFDPSLVRSGAFYALRARIVADGAVRFETQYPQLFAPLSGDPQTPALVRAATA